MMDGHIQVIRIYLTYKFNKKQFTEHTRIISIPFTQMKLEAPGEIQGFCLISTLKLIFNINFNYNENCLYRRKGRTSRID